MYSSVALSIFLLLCNHHHYLSPGFIHLPKLKFCIHYKITLCSLPPTVPGTTTVLLSASMNSATLGTSYKWSCSSCPFMTGLSIIFLVEGNMLYRNRNSLALSLTHQSTWSRVSWSTVFNVLSPKMAHLSLKNTMQCHDISQLILKRKILKFIMK